MLTILLRRWICLLAVLLRRRVCLLAVHRLLRGIATRSIAERRWRWQLPRRRLGKPGAHLPLGQHLLLRLRHVKVVPLPKDEEHERHDKNTGLRFNGGISNMHSVPGKQRARTISSPMPEAR